MQDITKSPRVYVPVKLSVGQPITLGDDTHHYLKNVMRIQPDDRLRVFNEKEGEFIGVVSSIDKKNITIGIKDNTRAPITRMQKGILIIPPLKKERMDMVIEKSVELDVTDIYTVLTQNTDVRQLNEHRIKAQMIEAAEQCERMDIPTLHPLVGLDKFLSTWDNKQGVFAAIERIDATPLKDANIKEIRAVLIGPAGGFTADEKKMLCEKPFIKPISLGQNILRAETAAIKALSLLSD